MSKVVPGFIFNEITKKFCDNPNCPNHRLPLNDERHYHTEDEDVFGAICGIVQSHIYEQVKVEKTYVYKWIIFKKRVNRIRVKHYNFCDICISAIKMVERGL